MELSSFDAVSPVDGRYRKVTAPLADYFSEAALMRYRVKVELAYFIELAKLNLAGFKADSIRVSALQNMINDLDLVDVKAIKKIEETTNHDVKAVEYYIKETFADSLGGNDEFVHFGLTSQDINNTAGPLALKDAMENIILPALTNLIEEVDSKAEQWREIPLLAHTHGQPASPTALGKEVAVFSNRIKAQLDLLHAIPYSAKFGGATGNFNAHYAAYPEIEWTEFGNDFLNVLDLTRQQITTQIENYDHLAALFDAVKRINNILIDFARDMWMYISMNYFTQEVKKGEVGSSAMPHKVNPIDFENAEGNLGFANAIFEHLSAKLPVSRLQRDLTDSTVLRNTGVPFAHTLIAIKSLLKGLSKVKVNISAIGNDLEENWSVVAEAIQTVLRREGFPKPYEALKELTRTGEKINKELIHDFISKLNVSENVKKELLKITPRNYTGNAFRF